jgi:hypothetical protein
LSKENRILKKRAERKERCIIARFGLNSIKVKCFVRTLQQLIKCLVYRQ